MSIGIIERLSYSKMAQKWCLTFSAKMPIMILIALKQLGSQQKALRKCLQDRLDRMKICFTKDVTSGRTIWNILLEMLDQCNCQRVYIIVDALDECQDDGAVIFWDTASGEL